MWVVDFAILIPPFERVTPFCRDIKPNHTFKILVTFNELMDRVLLQISFRIRGGAIKKLMLVEGMMMMMSRGYFSIFFFWVRERRIESN